MSARRCSQLAGVHTHIGAYHILHGVDFEVPAGEVTMLLGRNGAGKTTTLRTIMGLWAASQGRSSSTASDRRPGGARRRRARASCARPRSPQLGIAYVPENMGIFADLSVPRTCCSRRARRAASTQLDSGAARVAVRPVPGAEEVLALSRPASSRAGRSRCSRSPARWSSRAACC